MNHKVAIITGAGSGIGQACAVALFNEGYRLVLAGRRQEPLLDLSSSLRDDSRVIVVPTDIANEGAVAHLFDATVRQFGRLDLLFNNAGSAAPPTPLEDLPLETWQHVVNINLTGTFLCTRQAIRVMKVQNPMGGRIINNGSISAHVPRPNSAPYTSTKHAVTGLTRSTSLDGRKYDIVCGQIDIGNARTRMTDGMSAGISQADGTLMPEPIMDVDTVARAIVYMDSLPLDANVQFMTVLASKMPYIGRG